MRMIFSRIWRRVVIGSIFVLTGIILFHSRTTDYIVQKIIPKKTSSGAVEAFVVADTATPRAKQFYNHAVDQIGVVTAYDFSNGYYGSGSGYPPEYMGVCTDTIARAFDLMGSGTLREKVDSDIQKSPTLYPSNFDTYINFRRVKNLQIFFSRKTKTLTNEMKPFDKNNLWEWQTGDIVIFESGPFMKLWHIAIISDKRRDDGVPYMIDNHGIGTNIRLTPLDWPTKIVGHYRYF